MSIKILHAADLHMDSPFDGLSDELAALRRSEQRRLLDKIAALAREEKVDLVLLCGDLLDSDSSYAETALALRQALGSISVPVVIAPGNHDYYSTRSPYARLQFPENVHIFNSEELSCVEFPEINTRVWGAGFTDPHAENLLSGFSADEDSGYIDILLLHADAQNRTSPYCPVSEADLAQSGVDYAALGHIHSFSGLKKAGDVFYAWPGCPEGRGFDELGEKGVIIADVDKGECAVRFVPLDGRRYEILTVDLTGSENQQETVLSSLPGDTQKHIYRIILTGETPVSPDTEALRRALEERFFALQLRDSTVPCRDIWQDCGKDTLRGIFLQKLRDAYDAAETQTARDEIIQAVRWGLAALDGGEELR